MNELRQGCHKCFIDKTKATYWSKNRWDSLWILMTIPVWIFSLLCDTALHHESTHEYKMNQRLLSNIASKLSLRKVNSACKGK